MREADSADAIAKIEAIAQKYRQLRICQDQRSMTDCTFSAGVAEYPRHGSERNELLMRADTALVRGQDVGPRPGLVAE